LRILMIGDIVGRSGRKAVMETLTTIRQELKLDIIVANGENAAGGNGITSEIAKDLFGFGVDIITSGNHIWDKKEIISYIDREPRLLRPANYPSGTPGKGVGVYNINGFTVGVINLSGRVYMPDLDCPFKMADVLINNMCQQTNIILVDFHAEATSEKVALSRYLDGRISAFVGTHTHIQTADEKILSGGTAYITDLGMTGPYNSVIGVKVDLVLHKFTTQMPVRFEVADGPYQFNAVVIEVDEETGKAESIDRVYNVEYLD